MTASTPGARPGSGADPVVARRARIAILVKLGKRVGYLALLVAIVGFGAGAVTGFSPTIVRIVVTGLVVACVVLPLPIVVGYGLRAAEREDRER